MDHILINRYNYHTGYCYDYSCPKNSTRWWKLHELPTLLRYDGYETWVEVTAGKGVGRTSMTYLDAAAVREGVARSRCLAGSRLQWSAGVQISLSKKMNSTYSKCPVQAAPLCPQGYLANVCVRSPQRGDKFRRFLCEDAGRPTPKAWQV